MVAGEPHNPHEVIRSLQNPRVKMWSSLHDKKGRTTHKRYLLEGIHLVKEALLTDVSLETLIYPESHGIPQELAEWQSDERWLAASDAVFEKCCATKTPQPVLAVAEMHETSIEEQLLHWQQQATTKSPYGELVVVADGVQDPGNVGTMIRSALAIGADAVILGAGCADLYAPKTVRATMGALFRLPVVQVNDLPQLLLRARQGGAHLLTTSLNAEKTMYQIDFRERIWLIFGSEGAGVTPEVSILASQSLRIPMSGFVESLNVAMATTVILYEAFRQRSLI